MSGLENQVGSVIPPVANFLVPALEALRRAGGSLTIQEMLESVIEVEGFSEEQQAVLHQDGPRTELEYRLAWARTWLKGIGAVENSTRGVWSLTEYGRKVAVEDVATAVRDWRASMAERRRSRAAEETDDHIDEGELEPATWEDELLSRLLKMPPDAFERLSQRLLREAGFVNVTVTGRSGDGGIDGIGVYRLSLVSFPVYFQCKRYSGSVSSPTVRDFRGAMVGRGEKGLLITTGTFTAAATAEANRDGAPPIDLIDGERLCHLLKEYEMGVRVSRRTVEDIRVEQGFFDEF